ncbi:MAG: thioredoxin domain-containing protein [Lachnospiraceae bacterium]|nr:thioredoxin domain-containing protein [Lachnospiraceae bacterium]
MAERVGRDEFEGRVLSNGKLSLIEFYHDGCVACKMLSPVLAEIEEKYGEQLYVGKVNTVYEEELTEEYKVKASPTLIFFKDGRPLLKLIGTQKKNELEKIIEENL